MHQPVTVRFVIAGPWGQSLTIGISGFGEVSPVSGHDPGKLFISCRPGKILGLQSSKNIFDVSRMVCASARTSGPSWRCLFEVITVYGGFSVFDLCFGPPPRRIINETIPR